MRPSAFNMHKVEEVLADAHRRLARTTIEKLDACECIKRYDAPHTFFYIDPPYWNSDVYVKSFSGHDYIRLRNTLLRVKGKFVLSLNDTPEVRELFSAFTIEPIYTSYSLGNAKTSAATRGEVRREVLIHNLEASPND